MALSSVGFSWTGLRSLVSWFNRVEVEAKNIVAGAVYEESLEVFNRSQREVPVRYGILKGSGFLNTPIHRPGSVEVTMGYGGAAAPYALFVHERTFAPSGKRIRHASPTKSKFLEDPVVAAERTFGANVGRRLYGRLFPPVPREG